MAYHAYGFVDGAYLRALARDAHTALANPYALVENVAQSPLVQNWCAPRHVVYNVALAQDRDMVAFLEWVDALLVLIERHEQLDARAPERGTRGEGPREGL